MSRSNPTMAQQIAEAAAAFEQQRTGHVPRSATVVLNDDTLFITLYAGRCPPSRKRPWPEARQVPPRYRNSSDSWQASRFRPVESEKDRK